MLTKDKVTQCHQFQITIIVWNSTSCVQTLNLLFRFHSFSDIALLIINYKSSLNEMWNNLLALQCWLVIPTMLHCQPLPEADTGFWFGRGTGRRSGDRSPQEGSRGTAPVGIWGQSPQKPEECYIIHLQRKNKPIQTYIVWQYHNYHHLIHSSLSVFSYFCLKIQNTSNFCLLCN